MEGLVLEIKPRFRFRYNGLLALCIILSIFIIIQQAHISRVEKVFEKYALVDDVYKRAQYVNHRMKMIEYRLTDVWTMANTAERLSNHVYKEETGNPNDWIVGLTTDQVDSVLILRKKTLMEKYEKELLK